MKKGKIIWLNGVSSAGKSTLVRALQRKLPNPYFCIGQDTFTDIIAPWLTGEFNGEKPDRLWFMAVSAMNHTVKLYSDLGYNVIVDHVILKPEDGEIERPLNECVSLLYEYPVLFVKVTCPLHELQRREIERGDREIGNAEWQFPLLHPQDTYDMTVNTFENTTEECADQIIEMIEKQGSIQAFRILKSQL
jgi:chloramphenicol 3-O phosphotransferase